MYHLISGECPELNTKKGNYSCVKYVYNSKLWKQLYIWLSLMPITSSENWYTYLKYYSELKVLMNLQWWHNTNELTLWWHSKSHNVAYQSCISFFTKYRYLPYHHISPKTWTCFITFPNLYFFHTMHHTSINIVTLFSWWFAMHIFIS